MPTFEAAVIEEVLVELLPLEVELRRRGAMERARRIAILRVRLREAVAFRLAVDAMQENNATNF